MEHKYPDLARRLAIAYATHQTGRKSMDLAMRQRGEDDLGPYWQELAERVVRECCGSNPNASWDNLEADSLAEHRP
jgi:hypothetical protein